MKKALILLLIAALPFTVLYSQSELYTSTVESDIATSNFYELTDWCRRLDLPEDGSVTELRNRLYSYYEISPENSSADNSARREIIIEKADNLKYFTIERIDENYAKISGDVYLKLTDEEKNETHIVEADTIIFNFKENYITATGNIKYQLEGDTKTENFRGEKLTFNVDSTEGLFDKGITEQQKTVEHEDSGSEEVIFYFKGDLINKTEENFVVLENGEITSCDLSEPHFKIKATKLWLLTSNEWAIVNGVIHIGRVPMFYFPAFLYGGDDIFFNPSFGYMSDFGYYIQTTSYLIGRKTEEAETAFSFMQTDTEYNYLKREGLYLTEDTSPTDKQKALQDYGRDSKNYLKLLLDGYSYLGFYSALDLKMSTPSSDEEEAFPDFINSLLSVFTYNELYISAARTRKLENTGSFYAALFADDDGVYSSIWEDSYFLGIRLPFRYGFDYSTTADLDWLSTDLSIESYSDRDYTEDFFSRSENYDLLALLESSDDTETSGSTTSSTVWDIDLTFSPDLSVLKPWLNSSSLKAESSLNWNSKAVNSEDESYEESYDDVVDYFFYPNSYNLPIVSTTLSGSLIQSGNDSEKEDGAQADKTHNGLEAPWEDIEKSEEIEISITGVPDASDDIAVNTENYWDKNDSFSNSLTYSITPKYSDTSQYDSSVWNVPEDISFEDISYSYRDLTLDGELEYSANVFGSLIDFDNTLSFDYEYSEHYNMDSLSEDTQEDYLEEDNLANDWRLENDLSLSTTPLGFLDFLDETKITYNMDSVLYKHDYSADSSSFYTEYIGFNDNSITEHELGLSVPSHFGGWNQSLSITTSLPPLEMETSGAYSLNYGFGTSKFSTSMSESDDEFSFESLVYYQTFSFLNNSLTNNLSYNYYDNYLEKNTTNLNLSFLDGNITVGSNFIYDIQNNIIDNLGLTLSMYILDMDFNAKYTYDYIFDQEYGWEQSDEKDFLPSDFNISVDETSPELFFWKDRIALNFNVDSVVNMDLIQFTESYFTFGIGLDLEIYDFLDLSFKSTSINSTIYRYFSGYCEETGMNQLNFFSDLLKSFNFFDIDDRYESNFNLQSISVGLVHDLHDWDLNISYTGSPYVNDEDEDYPFYDWESQLEIYLKWKSIPDIKSEIEIDNDSISF